MNATVFIPRTIANFASRIIYPIAFFPARAVGDKIGNYAIASAGTIVNKNASDDSGNLNTTTESICPKGWALPTTKQIDANRDTTNFDSVSGGYYRNGALYNEAANGYWWGNEAYTGTKRYLLNYNGSNLYTGYGGVRHDGYYIRCVSEEKTVADLTYLQDMTGEIADNMLDGYRELTTYDLI